MSYKQYKSEECRVKIISTGEEGEAYEEALGFISVFIDGENKCRYFEITDVEFINPNLEIK